MKKRIISLLLAVIIIIGMLPLGAITAFAETVGETHTLTFLDALNKTIEVAHGECLPAEDFPKPDRLINDELALGWQYEKGGETYFFNETVPVTEDLTLTYLQMSIKEITDYTGKKEISVSDKTSLTTLSGIYTVSANGDIVIDNRCAVIGFAVIILPDGCNITFAKGINAPEYRKLFIIVPDGAKGTGKLTATGGEKAAGIGGDVECNSGTVYIYGGTVKATGGFRAAGIGGGYYRNGGTVYIYGGMVTATGDNAAGIGGGDGGNGGTVHIYGGTVNATGGYRAVGIGGNGGTTTISGGVVRARGTETTALKGEVTLRSNMTAYDITNGEENAHMTSKNTSAAKILVMPTAYDYLAVERNAYIDTGYRPTNNTRVVMNVDVKGGREYWFGVWDINFDKSAFAFGNDMTGIYTGYGDEGGTYGQAVSNGYHTVELDKNSVKVDGNSINTHKAAEFQLNNTLYLFAQNRAGEAMVYADQSAVIHCYGCEIYEGDTLVRKFVPGKSSSGASGLWDVVNGVFCDNQYESKEQYAGMTAYYTGNVETVSEQSPTCTEDGFSAYYKKSGKYYTDAECTEEITDLSVWLSTSDENGGGILPALGHDWDFFPEKHTCDRCKLEEPHIDVNNDRVCDACGNNLLTSRDVVYLNRTVNETTGDVTTEEIHYTGDAYTVLKSDKVWGESEKTTWYILDDDVTLNNRVEVRGDVRLILTNGKTLTANNGITVEAGNSLSIYAQTDDESKMGTLSITAPDGMTAIGGKNGGRGFDDYSAAGGGGAGGDGYNGGTAGIVFFFGGKSVLSSTGAVTVGGGNGGDGGNGAKAGGDGGNGGVGGNVYFYGGCQTLSATNTSVIGGGNGGNGGTEEAFSGSAGSGGNGGGGGSVYFYGGHQTLTTTNASAICGGKGGFGNKNGGFGADATVTVSGSLLMKAGENKASAVKVTAYEGQKYLQVLPAYEYYEYNTSAKAFERKSTQTIPTPIESNNDDLILDGGWYIVSGEVTVKSVTFKGNADIIIANDAVFTATNGISAVNGANLTFYAQTEDFDQMGKVVVTKAYPGNAGIGSKNQGVCGDITINGGVFDVLSGVDSAGIGGGADSICGTITVNGGKIFTKACDFGAGLGSGSIMNDGHPTCAGVVINGGAMIVIGGDGAQNIGAGYGSGEVSVDTDEVYKYSNDPRLTYVNIEPFPQTEPSCVAGHLTYFKNHVNGKYYTSDYLEPDDLIENIATWLAGEGKIGAGDGIHKDTDNDGYCDGCGTFTKTKINFYISHGGNPAFTMTCTAGEELMEQVDTWANQAVKDKYGTTAGLVNYMYSNGNLVKEYDLVPFGTESMNIYAVLAYDETEPSCWLNGHKAYYENTQDGYFYENDLCTQFIGDADALAKWLADVDGGLNGAALGHIDENSDGKCDRCEETLVETYPETASTCETTGHKAYYRKIDDGLYYEDVGCTKKIGIYEQLRTWLLGIGSLPLSHHLGNDGTCSVCGKVLTKYYVFNEKSKEFELKGQNPVTQIVASSDNLSLTEGWYLIEYNENKITVENRISVSGNVHIILANYAELIAKQGIGIANSGSLTIYAQTLDTSKMGKLTVLGAAENYAGIGSGFCGTCGDIVINGGVIKAIGGKDAAGIGSGYYGTCTRITINGGVVTATGGYEAAGIGSGLRGTCGNITINGGVIDVTGDDYAAGIGSGYHGTCTRITINGGVVTATSGGDYAAGIGSGYHGACTGITINDGVVTATGGYEAAGIGSGYCGTCGDIVINGGVIKAIGGKDAAGIGSGYAESSQCSDITINGGVIKSTGGETAEDIGSGNNGTCGEVTYGDNPHTNDGSEWVNLEYIAGHENTCTIAGAKDAYKNLLDENYYVTFPFTSTDLIGNETAFESWLSTAVTNGGGMIPATGHIDKNSDGKCDRCGATMDSDKPTYTDASLTLDSNIFLNFYLNLTDEARQGGTMTFDIGGRIVTGVTAKYNSTVNKYYFACPITALEMAETVTATFSYNGEDYIQTYSVEDYIEEIIGNEEKYGAEAAALAHKIANYGHYAQIYLASIHTNVTIGQNGYAEIARSKKYNINVGTATTALNANSLTVAGATDALNLYGTTVYFDSATALNYYVKATGGTQPTATAVNLVTEKNKTVEIKHYKDDIYIVSVKDIIATELADNIAVTVNGGLTITGSVFAYCKAVMNKEGQTESAKNAMAAFYEYHVAACGYHNTLN